MQGRRNLITERRRREKTNDGIAATRLRVVRDFKFEASFAPTTQQRSLKVIFPPQQGSTPGPKIKKGSEIAGSVSGKKTKPGKTGRGRNDGSRPELIHAERGEHNVEKPLP